MKYEDLTEAEKKTFDAQLRAFRDAWDDFKKTLQKEIGIWVETFLDKILICGNCLYWKHKGNRPAWGRIARCEVKKYLVDKKCHACPFFCLDERAKEHISTE